MKKRIPITRPLCSLLFGVEHRLACAQQVGTVLYDMIVVLIFCAMPGESSYRVAVLSSMRRLPELLLRRPRFERAGELVADSFRKLLFCLPTSVALHTRTRTSGGHTVIERVAVPVCRVVADLLAVRLRV